MEGKYTHEDLINFDLEEGMKAEIIDGNIYCFDFPDIQHQDILVYLLSLISDYIRVNKLGCEMYPILTMVKLSKDKDTVSPDILVVCDDSKIKADGIHGAPDLVVEISSNDMLRYDKVIKMNKYKEAGVREYWVIEYEIKEVCVYNFETNDADKRLKEYYEEDILESNIFKGLKVNISELFQSYLTR